MKKLKFILCILLGYDDYMLSETTNDGYCKRCGWGKYSEAYTAVNDVRGLK